MGIVYCIEHVDSGKKYIGSTIQKIGDRWRDHRKLLNKNAHDNDYLQNAWNLYGADSFKWWIVEDNINDDILLDRERYWTEFYNALDRNYGYNIVIVLGGGAIRISEATKQLMREASLGKPKSEEHKQKLSEAQLGKHHTEEVRQRMSDASLGKPKSEKHKRNISLGQQGEKSYRAKLTDVQVLEIIELLKQGVSCAEIARRYSVSPDTIYNIKYKKSWKHLWL